jgi:hypothetical protein
MTTTDNGRMESLKAFNAWIKLALTAKKHSLKRWCLAQAMWELDHYKELSNILNDEKIPAN